ncbi:MAG TPA: DUF2917 domain-containing protein [Noviherbaspirillum sp.]|uniref:DUF2917 domain-containing protein n=1 Tax=Noviherbaspirillum sp. TaxID=1926288 RepID=UPI002B486D0B|nr:DUF2917 domain-containing protein [Noviherbaspirillum sp.]HJV87186.1 DUF2917 domain-containing protein [Noviherbaspirillum sp.]
MRGLFTKQALTIPAGETVSGVAGRAHTLRVTQGRVWITVEGISHDYWLHAGDTLTTIPGRITVVEADQHESRVEWAPAIQWIKTLKLLLADIASRFAPGRTVSASLKRHRTCNCGESA